MKQTEEAKKAERAGIDAVINGLKAQPPHVRAEFLTMCATTAISVMHGTFGKGFTADYLAAAVASLDDPTTVYLKEPTVQ